MSVTAASATATFTADQLTVTTGLSGQPYLLTSFSKTINLATTGAGGMDTGTVPAAGFVALYAIYNPTTQVSALLAVNTTSVLAPEVYGGANMPSGYTASALVSVWRTASSQFVIGYQVDRKLVLTSAIAINGNTQQASYTAIPLTAIVPVNAKTASGTRGVTSTTSGASIYNNVASSSSGLSPQPMSGATVVANMDFSSAFLDLPIVTTQTIYYAATASAGTMTMSVVVSGYTF
ncbi:phage tail protein [Yersinia enterocolitica]|nr:phage tail protein [Yersinia enterocolitica]